MNDVIESGAVDSRRDRKAERLAVRLSGSAKRVLERAAEIYGRSLSDFVVDSALIAARRAIEEYDRMRLRGEDREVFLAALTNPPEPSRKLRTAFDRYQSRIR